MFPATGQKCDGDGDCNEPNPCCSGFGFCGSGEGFCTPATRTGPAGPPPNERVRPSLSGAGCTLPNTEIVGGDIPVSLGGGGITVDGNTPESCNIRCDNNPACYWFTFDTSENLCYLKSDRPLTRNRTDGFVSGATFRDGCTPDPACQTPYSYYDNQCMYFSYNYQPWDASLADARRGLDDSRTLCRRYGGFLPYSYEGFRGRNTLYGDEWHWVNYGGSGKQCYACRPSRWGEGVRAFPCQDNLLFACQRDRAFSVAKPPRPPLCTRCQNGPRQRPPLNRLTPTLSRSLPNLDIRDLQINLLRSEVRKLKERELERRYYLRLRAGLERRRRLNYLNRRTLPRHRFGI